MKKEATAIIKRVGSFREKAILKDCTFCQGHTWNDSHKVVEVIANTADEDGSKASCEVDIVTGKIVG